MFLFAVDHMIMCLHLLCLDESKPFVISRSNRSNERPTCSGLTVFMDSCRSCHHSAEAFQLAWVAL